MQRNKSRSKKKNKDLYKKLIIEYGENKSYKNTLYAELLKLLNITDNVITINDEYSINVLNINIKLLSLAYNLAKESKEKEKIEKKYNN